MRILFAYNQHRGGGGSDNFARATIEICRQYGLEVEVFTRSSEDLPDNIAGRLKAATSAVYASDSVKGFVKLADSFKPDIVHIGEVFPLVSPWILPECSRRRIPAVMSCMDYRLTCPTVNHFWNGK